jgi:hypothetical protein
MSLSATEPEAPAVATKLGRLLAAVGWALAGAVCAGGWWAVGLVTIRDQITFWISPGLREHWGEAVAALVGGGAFAGLMTGILVGRIRKGPHRDERVRTLALLGALVGAVGGGLSVVTALGCEPWLHPLASSSLLWALVGLFAGLAGYGLSRPPPAADAFAARPKPSTRIAIGWALAAALCSGGIWAAVWITVRVLVNAVFLLGDLTYALEFAASSAGAGMLVGALAGAFRRSGERASGVLVLGAGGALFGTMISGASVLTATAMGQEMPSLVSSSLAVAAVGFLAGLGGYAWSRRPIPNPEPSFEEDEDSAASQPKVEWVLHEPKRPWRDPALVRITPVFAVAVASLFGAGLLAPSEAALALLVVGLLGLAVALVLYRQELRLEELERPRHPRE